MVEYIKQIAKSIDDAVSERGIDASRVYEMSKALAEEMNRLDPRDFQPVAQFKFVTLRVWARRLAAQTSIEYREHNLIKQTAREVISVLEQYSGSGSFVVSRPFAFIKDIDLRSIVERDYKELVLCVYAGGAWKSSVVLAGSIVEAILFDALTADPLTKTRAESSTKAPRKPNGHVRDLSSNTSANRWSLENLIEVAVDISVLPKERANTFDQVLRDYRNFVHPKKELRSSHPCSEAEATIAKGALDALCNHLTP